jgi:hypothetical protein
VGDELVIVMASQEGCTKKKKKTIGGVSIGIKISVMGS